MIISDGSVCLFPVSVGLGPFKIGVGRSVFRSGTGDRPITTRYIFLSEPTEEVTVAKLDIELGLKLSALLPVIGAEKVAFFMSNIPMGNGGKGSFISRKMF